MTDGTTIIERLSHCCIEQVPHGDSYFYRVISDNDIIVCQSIGPVPCFEYARWFDAKKGQRS